MAARSLWARGDIAVHEGAVGAVRIKGFRSPWLAQHGCPQPVGQGGYCGAPCGAVRIKGFRSPWLAQHGRPQRGQGGYCGAPCDGAVRIKGFRSPWLAQHGCPQPGPGGDIVVHPACDGAVRIKGFRSPWLAQHGCPQRGQGGYCGAVRWVRCGLKGSAALGWLSMAARSLWAGGDGGRDCGARCGAVRIKGFRSPWLA